MGSALGSIFPNLPGNLLNFPAFADYFRINLDTHHGKAYIPPRIRGPISGPKMIINGFVLLSIPQWSRIRLTTHRIPFRDPFVPIAEYFVNRARHSAAIAC